MSASTRKPLALVIPLCILALVATGGLTAGEHACPFHMEGVEVSVENLSNGVTVTLTSADEETARMLQELMAKKAAGGGCVHKAEDAPHHHGEDCSHHGKDCPHEHGKNCPDKEKGN
ncbi:MAG: hypothetical protein GY856_25955 [bacterium]|nr:hypothetical protein [bacterium]